MSVTTNRYKKAHFGDERFLQNALHFVVPDIIRGMMSGMGTCLPVRQAFGASNVPSHDGDCLSAGRWKSGQAKVPIASGLFIGHIEWNTADLSKATHCGLVLDGSANKSIS